jgi:hypothetical protein
MSDTTNKTNFASKKTPLLPVLHPTNVPVAREIIVIPQECKALLVKWICDSISEEKIKEEFARTGGKYANIYSWVSGSQIKKSEVNNEYQEKQNNALNKSYIFHENKRYHKTSIFLADQTVKNAVSAHLLNKYEVSLKKFPNGDSRSIISFRWVIQIMPRESN